MYRSEVVVFWSDADDLLGHLDSIGELGVYTRDEGVCLTCLHHHHAEVVALEHLIVCLLEVIALAAAFVGQYLSITLAAFALTVVTEVHYLDALQRYVQLLCFLLYHLLVAQQDRRTQTFGLSLCGSLDHRGVQTLGKHHALWVLACCLKEALCHARLQSHAATQGALILVPVGDDLTCHTALYGCLGHSGADLGDEAWVNGLRDEIVATEGEVVHLIHLVHHIWHGLLGQVGDGTHGCQLHLLVDGLGVDVQCTTEDIWETDDVVYLVGIVGASCRHQHVGTACHSVFIRNLRHRVGKGKDDRVLGHRAYHILAEHVALRESEEHVSALDGLLQRMGIAAVGGEVFLLFGKVLAVRGDDALRVEHQDILLLRTQRHIELRA